MFRAGAETLCTSRPALLLVLFLATSTACPLVAQDFAELRSGRIAQDQLAKYSELAVDCRSICASTPPIRPETN